jgi:NHL repeat
MQPPLGAALPSQERLSIARIESSAPARLRTALLAILTLVFVSLLVVPVAFGAVGHRYVGQFGGSGAADGDLSSPAGLAVRALTGETYVVDQGNGRVQRFDASGDFVSKFDLSATPGASLLGPIAVDEGSGDVYVAVNSEFGAGVQRFDASGTFLATLDSSGTVAGSLSAVGGLAVDGSSGDLYVADTWNNAVVVFDASGSYVSQFGGDPGLELSSPGAVAVDSTGAVYVADVGNARVQKFTARGASAVDSIDVASPQALAVDPTNDHLYVGDGGMWDFSYRIVDFDPSGERTFTFGAEQIDYSSGIGVTATGRVLAAELWTNVVLRFAPFVAPTVTTGDATDITADAVTLEGTVNPDGAPGATTYHFEYGTDTSYGSVTEEVDTGGGSSDLAASAAIAGLLSNTTYHYRLVASNPSGTVQGADRTFTTAAAGPLVDGSPPFASEISEIEATLNATVNPMGSPASYHFNYGTTTAYGSSTDPAAVDGLQGDTPVTATIEGLEPETTYHFQVVADNGVGGPVAGTDQTFTTRPPRPTAITDPVTDVTSTSAVLHGTVDTHGEPGVYRFTVKATDSPYSTTTDPTPVPAAGGPVRVSTALAELPRDGSFEVRVSVSSLGMSAAGDVQAFKTPAAPPTPPPPAVLAPPEPPAVAKPSNRFTIRRIRVNAAKATATLTIRVPGPGTVTVKGRGVRRAIKHPAKAGTVKVTIRVTTKARNRLALTRRRMKSRIAVLYRPTHGTSRTATRTLTFTRKIGR